MIGDMIKRKRIENGWTQEELAKRMGYKSKSTINKIELGINDVNQQNIVKFAKVLGTTIPYLMELEEVADQTDGDKLKSLRLKNNLTLAELAGDLHISVEDINAYENNIKQIPSYVASAVANYFGIEQPQPQFHAERFNRMVEAMQGEILSDEEFDKVIDYVKFIVSQRG